MNDRFKFRYYDEKSKRIYDVCFIDFDCPCVSVYLSEDELLHIGKRDFKWENLMQSTALKDKNEKLIYRGDILGDIYERLYIHYCNQCKQFQLYSQGYGCMACNGDIHWIEVAEDNKKLEVIGNIYENKELLNDK